MRTAARKNLLFSKIVIVFDKKEKAFSFQQYSFGFLKPDRNVRFGQKIFDSPEIKMGLPENNLKTVCTIL
jgi:hypothetical protein